MGEVEQVGEVEQGDEVGQGGLRWSAAGKGMIISAPLESIDLDITHAYHRIKSVTYLM